ncbi:MAG: hypothetical protein K2X66_14500 [Cyanobacteria bacterium]|nr:hypothetical protein [Cyanobacteriota bacterium]
MRLDLLEGQAYLRHGLVALLEKIKTSPLKALGVLVSSVFVMWLYWGHLETESFGFIKDDGVYFSSGYALAMGEGFRLAQVVGEPYQMTYPIVYPLILALGWLLNPHFPENLVWITALSTSFGLAFFGLLFFYYHPHKSLSGRLAFFLVLSVALHPRMLYYLTSLMSEGTYLFFSLATLFWGEVFLKKLTLKTQNPMEAIQQENVININGFKLLPTFIFLIVLSTITYHTRMIGITLILAFTSIFWLRGYWKWGIGYLGLCLLTTVVPWYFWLKFASQSFHNIFIRYAYISYNDLYQMILQNPHFWDTLLGNMDLLVLKIGNTLLPYLSNGLYYLDPNNILQLQSHLKQGGAFQIFLSYGVLGLMLIPLFLRIYQTVRIKLQKQDVIPGERRLEPLSPTALYTIYYLFIILVWNLQTEFPRFLLMILPFMFLYGFKGLRHLIYQLPNRGQVIGLCFLLFPLLWFMESSGYYLVFDRITHEFRVTLPGSPQRYLSTPDIWQDYRSSFSFIKTHLPEKAPVGCERNTAMFFYTQHPIFPIVLTAFPTPNGYYPDSLYAKLWESIDRYHVTYLMDEPNLMYRVSPKDQFKNPVVGRLHKLHPERFVLLYESPRQWIRVYQLIPAPDQTISKL